MYTHTQQLPVVQFSPVRDLNVFQTFRLSDVMECVQYDRSTIDMNDQYRYNLELDYCTKLLDRTFPQNDTTYYICSTVLYRDDRDRG